VTIAQGNMNSLTGTLVLEDSRSSRPQAGSAQNDALKQAAGR